MKTSVTHYVPGDDILNANYAIEEGIGRNERMMFELGFDDSLIIYQRNEFKLFTTLRQLMPNFYSAFYIFGVVSV
jgi:hypothetical protein